MNGGSLERNEVTPVWSLKMTCPCGCGTFGTLKKKVQRDGLQHVGRCPCKRCSAPRHKANARRRENTIAKDIGGTREVMSGALSGADVLGGMWSVEETSEQAVTRGFKRWVLSLTVQRKVARLFSRTGEAHALVLSWEGKPRWVVMPYEDWSGQVKRGEL